MKINGGSLGSNGVHYGLLVGLLLQTLDVAHTGNDSIGIFMDPDGSTDLPSP